MQLYSAQNNSSISIDKGQSLINQLNIISQKNEIQVIIETGTYTGLGSTKLLAEIFSSSNFFEKLYSCEVNWVFYEHAKKNLKSFSKISCLYGLTVNYSEALRFIKNDSVLSNHRNYPEIFIDNIQNPVDFYIKGTSIN